MTLLLSAVPASYGATVNCTNSAPGDANTIQNALNAGGTVTLGGTCNLGGTTLTFGSNVTLNGNATLNYTGSAGFIFASSGSNNTINGLTLNGGGINIINPGAPPNGWAITNNTIQNITSSSGGGVIMDILGKGAHSTISHNAFINIWTGGYPAANQSSGVGAIFWNNGLDNTLIDSNTFLKIGANAIKGFMDGFQPTTSPYGTGAYVAHNIVISNNDIQQEGRIGIEVQAVGKCSSGCNYSPNSDGTIVKGNYVHNFYTPINNTFAYSLMFGGTNMQYINNSAVNGNDGSGSCDYRLAIALENEMNGGIVQGNTLASVPLASPCQLDGVGGSVGWQAIEASGYTAPGYTNTWINNVYCQPNTNWHNTDGYDSATYVYQGEYTSTSCASGLTSETSNIALAFTSTSNQAFPNGGNGTWSASVVSNLAIRNVSFYLDGSATPAAVQEVQDYNANFPTNRKWLYHATLSTTSIASGQHTMTAKATDVSGAVQSVAQTFTVGSGSTGTPATQMTPSSLSFGSETIGLRSAAQTIALKNTGSAPLAISGLNPSGANASDFSLTSTCGASLAVGASCSLSVTFTPSITGAETATLSISDNAAGSPQSASLSGTGASASSPVTTPTTPPVTTTLPTNLPKGMNLWLANDAGLEITGNGVSTWQDQSGNGNDAVQSSSANQPTVVPGNNAQKAVHFDGSSSFLTVPSLPIDGLTGMTVFIVSANNNDVSSSAGYGLYALLSWQETASWGETFFGSYQTSSQFRFGTMQSGNENTYQMPFTRTDSFGLTEWMHAETTDSMWFNAQSVGSYTGKSASIAGTGASASLGQGSNKTFYPGDVSEVIVYSRSLSSTERQSVETYLMSKYHL